VFDETVQIGSPARNNFRPLEDPLREQKGAEIGAALVSVAKRALQTNGAVDVWA
jgi:hypothetical protein